MSPTGVVLFGHSVPAMSGIAARLTRFSCSQGWRSPSRRPAAPPGARPARGSSVSFRITPAGWLGHRFRTHFRRPSEPPARPRSRSTRNTRARSTSSSRTSPMTARGDQNVYSVATQYYDNPGAVHIQYQSTFGGSYVDHDPLPANGCDDGLDTYCLTDQQLQNEIQTAMTAKGWRRRPDHIFFLMTPNGVGSCESAAGNVLDGHLLCLPQRLRRLERRGRHLRERAVRGDRPPRGLHRPLPRASRTTRTPTPRSTPSATSTTRRSPIRSRTPQRGVDRRRRE